MNTETIPEESWIQTFSGQAVTFLSPQPDQILIEDIAHALAYTCRFGGHIFQFYSVAQHSIFVCDLVHPAVALQGLLHDSTEAYLGDCVKPLKNHLPQYQAIEDSMWRCISAKFEVPFKLDAAVKLADMIALATERRDLHSQPPEAWYIDKLGIQPNPEPLYPWPSDLAEKYFLERFRELTHT